MIIQRFSALIFILSVFAFGSADGPLNLIKEKDADLQRLLRQDTKSKQRRDKLKVLINGIFDFDELGKKSLGSATYGSLKPETQGRFVKAFKEMIENSSLKKLEVYESDSTRYEEPEYHNKSKVSITAHTFSEGQESILVYKMFLKDGKWKAWDLVIDDLSTSRNYKEQFKRILKTKTIDDLIKILEEKAETESKPDTKASTGK
jgi:phospholipid transport system substrate-binding protein